MHLGALVTTEAVILIAEYCILIWGQVLKKLEKFQGTGPDQGRKVWFDF